MSDIPKITLTLPSGEIRKYSLQMDSIRIGRAADNTVVLEDSSLSGHHAVLHRRENCYELVDLGSTNGMEFQGRRVLTHELRDGDELKIGSVTLRFEWPGMPPPAPVEGIPPIALPSAPADDGDKNHSAGESRPEAGAEAPGHAAEPEPKGGCLASVLLFALTLLAPVVGMHIRHFQETKGRILISDIMGHNRSAKPTPAPSTQP